ncbi:hypothetical protein P5673_025877 [Acropora cervicornis]|uniref:Reverse transcriptase domain-containing protein n=1 Tax=Acropora cervicornis TaxID=6130 RepID=A0AAD9Q249_ACRCE|nr:hypothetical protein P5673_025877 [Acropora cervicornis]
MFFPAYRIYSIPRIIMSPSNATCSLDPMPTWLIKHCSDASMPTITQLLNLSLLKGHVPAPWKNAVHRLRYDQPQSNDGHSRDNILRWFKSNLDNRQQRVMIKQHMSDCFQLNSGVPQGSCLIDIYY